MTWKVYRNGQAQVAWLFRLPCRRGIKMLMGRGFGVAGLRWLGNRKGEGTMTYVINEKTCLGCGVCVSQCEQNAIEQINNVYQILKDKCTDCERCVDICPAQAISREER
jgi:ferredoxin